MTVETTLRDVRLRANGSRGDLVIADGKIASFGRPTMTTAARSDQLSGRLVLPGLWDSHVHMTQCALASARVDLSEAPSAHEAVQQMARAAAAAGAALGGTLIGYGYRDTFWPDRFEPEMLAWAAEDRQVALVSNDLHTAFLSSAALHHVGWADHPTGVLVEAHALDAVARLSQATEDEVDHLVMEALRAAAARGVTGVVDFEVADNLGDWSRRARLGQLPARVSCAVHPAYLDDAIERGLASGATAPGSDGLVEVGPLKLFVDGSLNAGTALCHDPYPGPGGEATYGVVATEPEELRRLIARGARHGILPALHAIGDQANTIALDTLEALDASGRIEHAQLVATQDLPRVARPGLVLGVQPAHLVDDRDVADRRWSSRTARAFALADLLHAGAHLEFGSDAPVSPLDPWLGIAAAVHRSGDDRPPWHPEQALCLDDALAATTRGRRVLQVGDPADLVVVDQDPTHLSAQELRQMPVHGTLLGGRWTYRSEVT